jgi:signal transduction histidine kinase
MENLRQVSNQIAHDLRTPLTRLRQRLERALSRAEGNKLEAQVAARAIEDVDRSRHRGIVADRHERAAATIVEDLAGPAWAVGADRRRAAGKLVEIKRSQARACGNGPRQAARLFEQPTP